MERDPDGLGAAKGFAVTDSFSCGQGIRFYLFLSWGGAIEVARASEGRDSRTMQHERNARSKTMD